MNGNTDSYKELMGNVEKVNNIFSKPCFEWTEEETNFILNWHSAQSGQYNNGRCDHNWEEKYLFRSAYLKCSRCGEEKDE